MAVRRPLGVIVAAGAGRRLGELGRRYSKPMVPVAGQPLIGWVMGRLRAAGVGRILVVGHASDRALASFVGGQRDCRLVVQEQRRGIADAVRLTMPYLAGAPGFLVCACDSLFPVADLERLIELGQGAPTAAVVAVLEMGVEATRSRSAVYVRGDAVLRIEEKPLRATSGLVAMPLYWLPRDIATSLEEAIPPEGEGYVSDALTRYIAVGGVVRSYPVTERIEVTTAEDVGRAAARLAPGP